MFKAKFAIIKCITALVIAFASVTSLVAYAAVDSKNKITVIDGTQKTEIVTRSSTAEEIISEQNISLNEGDTSRLELKDGVGTLTVSRAFPVHINIAGKEVLIKMSEGTVASALETAKVTLGEFDLCNKKLDEVLTKETYIDIMNVDYKTESYEEAIPFTTKVVYSDKLEKGKKNVVKGSEGVKVVTVKKTIQNGAEVSSEVVSETVTKEAQPETTIIGTKVVEKGKVVDTISNLGTVKVDENGAPLSYKKVMTFKATAYTSSAGAKCSTGVSAKVGNIAVNPNVIPYGTKMYIVSDDGKYVYGYAVAADTGAFAKRNPYMVDLYFNTKSECASFGVRNVKIYILE